MEAEVNRSDKEFGIIVRTNAADASKEEILKELEYLKGLYHKAAVDGRSRTCFSCVYRTEPFISLQSATPTAGTWKRS